MEKYADINEVHLHYTDTGKPDGKPVVLMHGWGCDTTTVASIAGALEDTRRVISIDLPGHGKSSEPPLLPNGKPWGVYEFAELVGRLIKTLNLSNPSLIGHSYGGRIAIVLGSGQNENGTERNDGLTFERIVLVDSAGIKPKRPLKYYWKVYTFKAMKKILPLLVGKKRANKIIERRRTKSGSSDYRRASQMMRMVMSRSVNQDLRRHLTGISAPTLLIWGENDTATPLSDAKLMEKKIPDAGLVSFRNAGHYSFLDNPGQFRAVIRTFFQ